MIKEAKGILYRTQMDFPEPGVKFIDLTPAFLDKEGKNKAFDSLYKVIKDNFNIDEIDYILSPDARGFLWGTAMSMKLDCPIIPVRKHGKLPDQCTEIYVEYSTEYSSTRLDLPIVDLEGKKCLFIDDVYATGGTYKACINLVEQAKGTMVGAVVVTDIEINSDIEGVFSVNKASDMQ